MGKSGLRLSAVPTELVQNSGQLVQESVMFAGIMPLGRWLPDVVIVLNTRRKIAIMIMDVIRPSDIRRAGLHAAHEQ